MGEGKAKGTSSLPAEQAFTCWGSGSLVVTVGARLAEEGTRTISRAVASEGASSSICIFTMGAVVTEEASSSSLPRLHAQASAACSKQAPI